MTTVRLCTGGAAELDLVRRCVCAHSILVHVAAANRARAYAAVRVCEVLATMIRRTTAVRTCGRSSGFQSSQTGCGFRARQRKCRLSGARAPPEDPARLPRALQAPSIRRGCWALYWRGYGIPADCLTALLQLRVVEAVTGACSACITILEGLGPLRAREASSIRTRFQLGASIHEDRGAHHRPEDVHVARLRVLFSPRPRLRFFP